VSCLWVSAILVSNDAYSLIWHPLGIEIDWCPRHKPEKLDLKDTILKTGLTRGAEVTYLEIRIACLVMNCA
jgi:hypothetical protein